MVEYKFKVKFLNLINGGVGISGGGGGWKKILKLISGGARIFGLLEYFATKLCGRTNFKNVKILFKLKVASRGQVFLVFWVMY